ncbi:MAG: imidazolonepropionase [Planctomycetota bacterium]
MSEALLIRGARVVSPAPGAGAARGAAMHALEVRDNADVLAVDGTIHAVGASIGAPDGARVVEAAGRVLLPAFVDCHTHLCWAGSRVAEWEAKLSGKSYLELLEGGGGIMSTVRAVRSASEDELVEGLLLRVRSLAEMGTLTAEAKSGYGLTTEDELKMLRAISRAAATASDDLGFTLIPTACIGHALDPGVDAEIFVERTIAETLPAVSEAFPGIAIDAYAERGAWSADDTERLLETAREYGHPARVHADQFYSLGLVERGSALGWRSVDHLEASGGDTLRALAASETVGVLLPCSGFHVDDRYADGRTLIDAGGAVAIGTNWNPGSSPCGSMAMAIALAVRKCGMTPGEAITAATHNGAAVLGLDDRGRVEPGLRADLILLEHRDERELAMSFGGNPVRLVIAGGLCVAGDAAAGL